MAKFRLTGSISAIEVTPQSRQHPVKLAGQNHSYEERSLRCLFVIIEKARNSFGSQPRCCDLGTLSSAAFVQEIIYDFRK